MTLSIHIRIPEGLKHASEYLEHAVRTGVSRSVSHVTQKSIENAPRKTGNLKRSIVAVPVESAGGTYLGRVKQDQTVAKYGPFVEFGTGIYGPRHAPITPKTASYLVWRSNGHWYRKKSVKGMRPRPYMRPALKESVPWIEDEMNRELRIAVERMGGG